MLNELQIVIESASHHVRSAHHNATGMGFIPFHKWTGEQYAALSQWGDRVAEAAKTIGETPIITAEAIQSANKKYAIANPLGSAPCGEHITKLLAAHEAIEECAKKCHKESEKNHIKAMLDELCEYVYKTEWMLKASCEHGEKRTKNLFG